MNFTVLIKLLSLFASTYFVVLPVSLSYIAEGIVVNQQNTEGCPAAASLRFFPILGIYVFMNDQDAIKEAYTDALKGMYGVLLAAFVAAPLDQHAQDQAKQRFSSGLALARKTRDAALALL